MRSFASNRDAPLAARAIERADRLSPLLPLSSRSAPTFGGGRRRPTLGRAGLCAGVIAAVSALAAPAAAQPPPRARPPATPATAPATAAAARTPDPSGPPPGPDMMAAVPGGITAEQVGARAAATSYQAKAAEETAASAAARVDGAWTNYLPRVGLKGSYTRLSEFAPPSLGSGNLVVTLAPAGTPNPPTISGGGLSFPLVFNQWLAQATIAVPISDYFLRLNESYTATTHQEEAARYDVLTARAKSLSDGKIAYFTWLRARGAVTVAEQSLAVARAHLKDSENQFAVGNASKADVLRAQTAVAAAELSLVRAQSGVVQTEQQVRIATHAKEDEKLEPGESLDSALPAPQENPKALIHEAETARPELKSIERNAEATRKLVNVANAGKYPVVTGFGDVTYANPNQRRFPTTQDWFPTWSAGAQITWSPNDLISANPQVKDFEARANTLEAQKQVTRDGIELEVIQAYQTMLEADTSILTTTRQLESAVEGYRVARELFNAGRGTATTLIDAENALAQTRFDHLNARVDARLARIRLDHALGRDVK